MLMQATRLGSVGDDLARLFEAGAAGPVGDAELIRRSAVVLCHVEGLDHCEAARRLRCPLGTLESRLHRARGRLRRALARRGLAPAGGLALTLHGLRSEAATSALVLSATARPLARR